MVDQTIIQETPWFKCWNAAVMLLVRCDFGDDHSVCANILQGKTNGVPKVWVPPVGWRLPLPLQKSSNPCNNTLTVTPDTDSPLTLLSNANGLQNGPNLCPESCLHQARKRAGGKNMRNASKSRRLHWCIDHGPTGQAPWLSWIVTRAICEQVQPLITLRGLDQRKVMRSLLNGQQSLEVLLPISRANPPTIASQELRQIWDHCPHLWINPRSQMCKGVTLPEPMVPGIGALAKPANVCLFILPMLLGFSCEMSPIEQFTANTCIIPMETGKPPAGPMNICLVQVLQACTMGNLLSNNGLPRQLSSEVYLMETGCKQTKGTQEVSYTTIRTDWPSQHLEPRQQGMCDGVGWHLMTSPCKTSQDWLDIVKSSTVPHASDCLDHRPITRITRRMFNQAQLNPRIATRAVSLQTPNCSRSQTLQDALPNSGGRDTMEAPRPGSACEGSDLQLIWARWQTQSIPHVMQTIGTGLESLVGVLLGQLEVGAKTPTSMFHPVSTAHQKLPTTRRQAPNICFTFVQGEVNFGTKGFKAFHGKGDMLGIPEEQLPIIHVTQSEAPWAKLTHPPMQHTIQENHCQHRKAITLSKASDRHGGRRQIVTNLKMPGHLHGTSCPGCQYMNRKAQHAGKLKNHWTAEAVESFNYVPYYPCEWCATVMALFNGKQNRVPNLSCMTTNPGPMEAWGQPLIDGSNNVPWMERWPQSVSQAQHCDRPKISRWTRLSGLGQTHHPPRCQLGWPFATVFGMTVKQAHTLQNSIRHTAQVFQGYPIKAPGGLGFLAFQFTLKVWHLNGWWMTTDRAGMLPSKLQNVMPLTLWNIRMPLPALRPRLPKLGKEFLKMTKQSHLCANRPNQVRDKAINPQPGILMMENVQGLTIDKHWFCGVPVARFVQAEAQGVLINRTNFSLGRLHKQVNTVNSYSPDVLENQLRGCQSFRFGCCSAIGMQPFL